MFYHNLILVYIVGIPCAVSIKFSAENSIIIPNTEYKSKYQIHKNSVLWYNCDECHLLDRLVIATDKIRCITSEEISTWLVMICASLCGGVIWHRSILLHCITVINHIFQTTFSNAFCWIKMYKFRLRFHWSLLPGVQLTIFQHYLN